jgi:ribosome-associated protein
LQTTKAPDDKAPYDKAPYDSQFAAPPTAPEHPVGAPIDSIEALHALILKSLEDDQALDLVTIPLAGKSAIADHMIICSGRSTRQVASMANKAAERIKALTRQPVRIEGLATADWVLIDANDVIIHIFRPEVRSFYNLERMWSFGEAPPAPATFDSAPEAQGGSDPETDDVVSPFDA